MTHEDEAPLEDDVASWFAERYGEGAVERQAYQPGPRWYVDIVVDAGFATVFVETESRASEIRPGVAQALGYAAAEPRSGVPVVVVPAGHVQDRKIDRLARSTSVPVREFDRAEGDFV